MPERDPLFELSASAAFRGVGPEAAAALSSALRRTVLPAGEALLSSEAAPHGLHLVLEGELHLVERVPRAPERLSRVIGPGEAVDELQVLAGAHHPLAVRAARETVLARLEGARVDALAARFPEVRAALDRLHRRQLLCRLSPLFGPLDGAFLDQVEAVADWVHLPRGRLLFEQNNPGEGLYLVISGRVRTVRYEAGGTPRLLGERGRGEIVGEMAFFGGERREDRVQAVRDSVLVGFTNEEFEALVAARPQILRRVTRTLVERLHHAPDPGSSGGQVTSVAVLPVNPGVPVEDFCARLARSLSAHGPVLRLTAEEVERRMDEPGIARAWEESPEGARLLAWLEAREADHRFVLYQAEPGATPWTRRCIRQADRVLRVGMAGADPRPGPVEEELRNLEGQLPGVHEVLVLLHPDGGRLPTGTRRWLEERRVKEHHHLRLDREADFARLGRVLAGRAVGLVLGGGGARGFAHVGILRALDEAGVPVDVVGGASIGASLAAQYALGMSADRMVEVNRRIYLEMRPQTTLTFPLLSLVSSRRAEACGEWAFGEVEIEDLWIPFFCISSDLTTAEAVVHRRGLVRKAALASASIPVFSLPVLEGGHLLVDGALMNNVPTDVLRQVGCGVVLASEVSVEVDTTFTCERIPSAWELLRARFTRRPDRARFPSMVEIAMRAGLLHSTSREREALQDADFAFRPPVDEFWLMEFSRLDRIVEVGYAYGRKAVRSWEEEPALRELLEAGGRG